MWKIGPECAAQHRKKVPASTANCGVPSALQAEEVPPSSVGADPVLALAPAADPPVSFVFYIAIGVKKGSDALVRQLDAALLRRKPEIDAILAYYGVPRVP